MFFFISYHNGMSDARQLQPDQLLDFLRHDNLARLEGDEALRLAVNHEESSVVQTAHVAELEPGTGVLLFVGHDLARLDLLVQVAHENVAAPATNLKEYNEKEI